MPPLSWFQHLLLYCWKNHWKKNKKPCEFWVSSCSNICHALRLLLVVSALEVVKQIQFLFVGWFGLMTQLWQIPHIFMWDGHITTCIQIGFHTAILSISRYDKFTSWGEIITIYHGTALLMRVEFRIIQYSSTSPQNPAFKKIGITFNFVMNLENVVCGGGGKCCTQCNTLWHNKHNTIQLYYVLYYTSYRSLKHS